MNSKRRYKLWQSQKVLSSVMCSWQLVAPPVLESQDNLSVHQAFAACAALAECELLLSKKKLTLQFMAVEKLAVA